MSNHISASERREAIDATRGYITEDGIVICGECRTNAAFEDTVNRCVIKSAETEARPYNPQPYTGPESIWGDDWCSICDRDITGTHPNA